MDKLIESLLTVGGPLGTLVVVVWIFVQDRKTASVEHRTWLTQTIKSNQEWIDRMHTDHLTARQDSMRCIDKNTEAMTINSGAVNNLGRIIEHRGLKLKP